MEDKGQGGMRKGRTRGKGEGNGKGMGIKKGLTRSKSFEEDRTANFITCSNQPHVEEHANGQRTISG